jgi:hypothetical protein
MSNFINNEALSNHYNKLKYNILGSKTKEDAYFILDKYKSDTKCYNLMVSIINSRKYDHALDIRAMKKYIQDISSQKYKEDAYELISQIMLQTSDIAQIKTFMRIADMKNSKPQYISMRELKQRSKQNCIVKKCPHCGYKRSMPRDTTYVVCGYVDSGYDWEGCGKDWCFKCGKMLCKNWEHDQLYLPTNRFHDSKCCRKHSILNGHKYPEDYCRCNSAFIIRDS